jgi:hypothetical protein
MLDERVRWKGWGEVRFVLGRRIGREEGGILKMGVEVEVSARE